MLPLIGALGAILLLIGATAWFARRMLGVAPLQNPAFDLAVIQRIAVGPRQGIALVRSGSRVIAVSVGDGGVRHLFDLDVDPDAVTATATRPPVGRAFSDALRRVMRRATIVALLAILPVMAPRASAQAAPPPANSKATSPAPQSAAPEASAPAPRATKPAATAPATTARPRPASTQGATGTPATPTLPPRIDLNLSGAQAANGLHLSGSVGVVVLLGLLSLLPTLVLMTTSFTRILIVLHFVRQAIGTQNAPPTQLVAGLALILSGFVMMPTMTRVNRDALTPWLDGRIAQAEMLEKAAVPMREFMLRQTRPADIDRFVRMSGEVAPATAADVPFVTLMAAFSTSELRTAFTLGFAIFLPFIVIDLVTSSVLMSLGMFMLPPATVALPFKLLLFVLVDGWGLVAQSLVTSFR